MSTVTPKEIGKDKNLRASQFWLQYSLNSQNLITSLAFNAFTNKSTIYTIEILFLGQGRTNLTATYHFLPHALLFGSKLAQQDTWNLLPFPLSLGLSGPKQKKTLNNNKLQTHTSIIIYFQQWHQLNSMVKKKKVFCPLVSSFRATSCL